MTTKFRKAKGQRKAQALVDQDLLRQARRGLREMSLRYDAVSCVPIHCDWHDLLGDDMEGWHSFEANECDKCGQLVVLNAGQGGEQHKDLVHCEPEECPDCKSEAGFERFLKEGSEPGGEDDVEMLRCLECGKEIADRTRCEGHVSEAEGPMMSYWYPVEIDDCTAAAKKLGHLPLCVVEMRDGATGLALTGGGMDLSWEICEAFIRLGSYPPAHFEPPEMCGRGTGLRDLQIAEACKESRRCVLGQMKRGIERIDEMLQRSAEYEARQRREARAERRRSKKGG